MAAHFATRYRPTIVVSFSVPLVGRPLRRFQWSLLAFRARAAKWAAPVVAIAILCGFGQKEALAAGPPGSAAGYFGWKFFDRLRLDGMLTYGRINYGAGAGPVSGSFGADRLTGMSKLSGRYGFGTFYLEPSAMLTIASERQDSFTDTAAVFHDKFNFVVGRASTGGIVGVPLVWGTAVVTPTSHC